MRDPASAIVNAPPGLRRTAAVGLLVLVAAAGLLVSWWALSSLMVERDSIVENRETLGRLRAVAALKDGLLRESKQAAPAAGSIFLEGETEAVIRGNVQARLSSLVGEQGAALISVSNAADLEIGGVRYLGMRADLSGTVDAVYNVVVAIEMTTPLIVRTASIWTSGSAAETEAPQLTAQINVYGPLQPGEAAVKQGAAAP